MGDRRGSAAGVPASASALLGSGMLGNLAIGFAVQASRPSWFDMGESCAAKFGGQARDFWVEERFFPPRATCVSEVGSYEYLSPQRSVVLTVLAVAAVTILAVGLARVGRAWLGGVPGPEVARAAGAAARAVGHVLAAALLGAGVALAMVPAMVLLFLFGALAVPALAVALVAGAVLLATAVDGATGPARGGRAGSRRRGAVVGGLGSLATMLLVAVCYQRGLAHPVQQSGWLVALAAVPAAMLAAMQWIIARVRRPVTGP